MEHPPGHSRLQFHNVVRWCMCMRADTHTHTHVFSQVNQFNQPFWGQNGYRGTWANTRPLASTLFRIDDQRHLLKHANDLSCSPLQTALPTSMGIGPHSLHANMRKEHTTINLSTCDYAQHGWQAVYDHTCWNPMWAIMWHAVCILTPT